MEKSIVFMFSGQGSHYYQMGLELYENNNTFRSWMEKGDEIVQKNLGQSVLKEIYHPSHKKRDSFDNTLLTHPAIFMVEYSLAQVMFELGIQPDYLLGASLGEFSAASIAGVLEFEDALNAVIQQAKTLTAHCPLGAMITILKEPSIFQRNRILKENSVLTSVNFHSHFVISCLKESIPLIEETLSKEQINFQVLAVSKAFHSHWIDGGELDYLQFLGFHFYQAPHIPLVSCCYSEELTEIPDSFFWDIIRKPILLPETIEKLEKEKNLYYIDLGPSGTLATFIKYNLPANSNSKFFPTCTLFGQDLKNLAKLRSALE